MESDGHECAGASQPQKPRVPVVAKRRAHCLYQNHQEQSTEYQKPDDAEFTRQLNVIVMRKRVVPIHAGSLIFEKSGLIGSQSSAHGGISAEQLARVVPNWRTALHRRRVV